MLSARHSATSSSSRASRTCVDPPATPRARFLSDCIIDTSSLPLPRSLLVLVLLVLVLLVSLLLGRLLLVLLLLVQRGLAAPGGHEAAHLGRLLRALGRREH